jgi:ribosome-binding factor A
MSLRLQRVRELLKRQIGEAIRREIPVGSCGLICVNDVDVSSDLHVATVFIGVMGNADQQKQALQILEQKRKRIQQLVARAIILKYTPQIRFIVDDSIEKGDRVLRILEELDKNNPTE